MKNIKNCIKSLLFIVFVIFMVSCSKSTIKNPNYAQNLQYTKVIKIFKNNQVATLVNITYLNSANKKVWDKIGQNFIVGVYLIDNKDKKYQFSLNGLAPKSIKEIKKDDELYKNIAFKNNWAKYYLVKFDNIKNSELNFVYKEESNNQSKVVFNKEY